METSAATTPPDHFNDLRKAVLGLRDANIRFHHGQLKSVPHADLRQQYLTSALKAMAGLHGVTLLEPLHIDSNGEYSLVSVKEGLDSRMGCAPFGDFAAVLTRHQARTGVQPGTLCPENGWCRINHFGVENMLVEQARERGIER